MFFKRMRWVAVVLVLVGCLAGPSWAEELVITGSGNPEFILNKLAEAFNTSQSLHSVSVPTSVGTAGAIRDIVEGTTSLARVGRPLKESEREKGVEYLPMGRDPVVFVGGAGVTVKTLSAAQVLGIYRGEITNWSEVGGQSAHIRAIGREISDASRKAIAGRLTAFKDMELGNSVKMVHLDPEMIDLLDRYPTSLGFLNRSGLYACKTGIVPLSFEGVEPTTENMKNGRYPFWLEFGLIHKPGGLTGAGEAFIGFMKSDEGRRVLSAWGVVPVE